MIEQDSVATSTTSSRWKPFGLCVCFSQVQNGSIVDGVATQPNLLPCVVGTSPIAQARLDSSYSLTTQYMHNPLLYASYGASSIASKLELGTGHSIDHRRISDKWY
jgi:hypothetical protein